MKAKNAINNIAVQAENTPASGQNAPQKPSFKLEHLTKANGLAHEAAHDALSDVRATIDLARLIKKTNPKLFDFCLGLHKTKAVLEELKLPSMLFNAQPFLHVSGMFDSARGCLALMFPLAMHPTNKNELIAWNLAYDPTELSILGADEIRLRMFSKNEDLPAGVNRLPIKTVHLNKSPIVIRNYKTLSPQMQEKWGLNVEQQLQNAEIARFLPDMSALWPVIFKRPEAENATAPDVDADLYGGFVGNNDRRRLTQLITMTPDKLATARTGFDDERLEELVFRYKARNFPEILLEEESEQWEEHRAARLLEGEGGARSLEAFYAQVNELSKTADARGNGILAALAEYADSLA